VTAPLYLSLWIRLSPPGPVEAPPENIAPKVIAEAMPGATWAASHAVKRLCDLKGSPAVALAVIAVVLAKTELLSRQQVHGTSDDRGGAEARRSSALAKLDDAANEAKKWAFYTEDRPLRQALDALLPLVREAGRYASPKPKGGCPPLRDRTALVQRFRDLGAQVSEAKMIVSAVKGLSFDIPEPPGLADPS
jgi:hypothetical protein